MAFVSITLTEALYHMPGVQSARVLDHETLTVTSASADVESAMAAPSASPVYVTVVADDDVFLSIGLDPDASQDEDRRMIPAGYPMTFYSAGGAVKFAARLTN